MSQKYDSLGDKILRGKQMNIGMSTEGNTGGISGLASKQLVLVGLGALSISQSLVAGYGTISFSVPGQTNQALGIYAGSQTTGESSSSSIDARSLTFVGAGGVSVGLSNGSLIISGGAGGGGGTLTFFASSNTTGQSSSSTFNQNSINIRGAGIASVGYSAGELIISVPSGGGVGDGGNVLAAGTQTATSLGTVLLADSNGISFGMSGSTRITATYTVPTQVSAFAVGNSTQSSSGTIPFANWSVRGEGNVSVGVSNGSLVISGAGGGAGLSAGLTNAGNTVGNTGTVTGRLVLVGGNNVTMSGSTDGGSITVTVSGPNTQNWFSQAGVSNLGNTAGDTGMQGSRLVLAGGGAATLSQATAAGGLGTVTISVPVQSAQTLGVYASSQTTGQSSSSTVDARSITFVGRGIASVGMSAGSILIDVPGGGGGNFSGGLSNLGNTLGNTGVVSQRLVLAGIGAATLSGSTDGGSATVSISVPAQTAQTLGVYASSQTTGQSSSSTVDARSLTFVGQGGVSVGMSGGSVLISGGAGGGGGNFSAGISGGNTLGQTGTVSQRIVFAGGNNITLSGSTDGGSATVTISGPNTQNWFSQAGVSNLGNTAGDTGMQGSRLVFAGGANITVSQATAAGGLGTISIVGPTQTNQTLGIYAVGNTTGESSSSTRDARSLSFDGAGIVSVGMSAGTLRVSATQSAQTLGLYGSSQTTGQSSSSTVDARSLTFVGQGIVSVGLSAGSYLLSATQSGQAASGQNGSFAFQTLSFSNANNVSFGTSAGGAITASIPVYGTGNVGAISAAGASASAGTIVFSNSNNVTFGMAGNTVTASISVPAQTNQTIGIYASSQTTGQSSSSTVDARSLTVVGQGGVSVGMSGGSLLISGGAGGGAGMSAGLSNLGNTQGNTGLVTGRLVLVGTNNITLSGSTDGGSITISISGGAGGGGGAYSAGISNLGNTAGTTGLAGNQLVIVGSGPVSLSQSLNGGSGTLTINAPATSSISATGIVSVQVAGSTISIGAPSMSAGMSTQGGTAGQTGFASRQLMLIGGNNITLSGSTNGGSMSITISAGGAAGGGFSAGISTQGNTLGTTGFASNAVQFVGSRNVTLSQSTGGGGSHTITVLGPDAPVINIWQNFDAGAANSANAAVTHMSVSDATLWIVPLNQFNDVFPGQMSMERFALLCSGSATATSLTGWSAAHTSRFSIGIYSMVNATQISLLASGSRSITAAANTGNTGSYNGIRWLTFASSNFDVQPQLSNTQYFVGIWMRTSGAALTGSWGPMGHRINHSAQISGLVGAASSSNNSYPSPTPFHGYFSVSFTTGMPSSLAASQLIMTGSGLAQALPMIALVGTGGTGAYGVF